MMAPAMAPAPALASNGRSACTAVQLSRMSLLSAIDYCHTEHALQPNKITKTIIFIDVGASF